MDQKTPRIVIIGAGVAGIAAATSLLERGFDNVIIIEAENRKGGRVFTVPFGKEHVDLGAHWVHGEVDNTVYNLAHKLDLLSNSGDFTNIQFISNDGRSIPSDIGMTLFARSGNILEDEERLKNSCGSIEDYLVPRCRELGMQMNIDKDLLEAFLVWVTNFECTIEGCDKLSDASSAGLIHYKQCDGDPIMSWTEGGYSNIIDILLRAHPKSVGKPISLANRLYLNTEVKEIDWHGLTALVKCTDGQVFRADHVIVTVSLGVLKENYRRFFNPPLPIEKVRAIVGLGIGTVDKIYLKFPERWWPDYCSGFSLLRIRGRRDRNEVHTWERHIIGFYIENTVDPTVMTAWLVGQAAKEMEICSDEEVLDACHRILKHFLSQKYDIPRPQSIVRSKWYSNPHFRGSYSYRSVTTEALQTSADILAQPLANDYNKKLLLFAGEATHNHFYSTVHGALETGWREAKRIADMYSSEKTLLKKASL